MQLFLKILSVMANSVDAELTAPSDLGLHCLHFVRNTGVQMLGYLPHFINTISNVQSKTLKVIHKCLYLILQTVFHNACTMNDFYVQSALRVHKELVQRFLPSIKNLLMMGQKYC